MPRWVLTLAIAVAFAALYAGMAIAFADVSVANVVFGTILAAGVGAMVGAVFVAGRSRRRQPRV
jgi:putative Mn2+ efflux pump MntP